MWIQALSKVGRYDEARPRASAFRKHSPDSVFNGRRFGDRFDSGGHHGLRAKAYSAWPVVPKPSRPEG